MKFVDKATILVKAGDGGDGCVKLINKKHNTQRHIQMNSNGGNGGNIYLIADNNINTLDHFLSKKTFFGKRGENGRSRGCTGKNGKDTNIKVPIGTIIYDLKNKKKIGNLLYHKQRLIIAKGGNKGIGSDLHHKIKYKHKENKRKGKQGEKREIQLELILIADIGILGLPNTGKSTFLNKISTTKTKIADYPFTTLTPKIGAIQTNNRKYKWTIMEIPGLIKGSHNGAGLGIDFLKHLTSCKILLHFIELRHLNILDTIKDISIVRNELQYYNNKLENKTYWLIFNKIDLISISEAIKQTKQIISILKWKKEYFLVSGMKNYGVKELNLKIQHYLKQNSKFDKPKQ